MRFELGAAEIRRHVRGRAARATVRPRLQAVRRLAHMIESEKRQKRPRVTRGHTPRQVRAKDEKEKRYLTGSIQVQTLSCRNRCVHYAELS